jgi:hypothetical protein
MAEKFIEQETENGTVQKMPVVEDKPIFVLTEPDQIDDGDGDWGFTILTDKDDFIASVSYVSQAAAMRGRLAMAQALEEAVFIATSDC